MWPILRRLRAEGSVEVEMLPRVRQVVLAAHDVGDLHLDVVHHMGEVEDVAAIRPPDRHVRFFGRCEIHITAHHVRHRDGHAAELEADRSVLLHIGATRCFELCQILVIDRLALALEIRAVVASRLRPLIPVEPEPSQPLRDRLHRRRRVARLIGILDAQNERSAVLASQQPVEQRRARATDVKKAGGRGREADAKGERHGRAE